MPTRALKTINYFRVLAGEVAVVTGQSIGMGRVFALTYT